MPRFIVSEASGVGKTVPAMELLDNTWLSVEQTAERIDAWIMERIF